MFFNQTPDWTRLGHKIVAALTGQFGDAGLVAKQLGLVLVVPAAAGPEGYAHRGDQPVYPCSLVKAFHLVHALARLEEGRLAAHGELDRALGDMIRWSSNTATNYVIDLVTGTTGDTLLAGAEYHDWASRREGLNRFFRALDWPEWQGCNISQKLMDDTRYGREAQFAGADGGNLNRLTPLAAARLFWAVFHGGLPLSPGGLARARAILHRDAASPDAAEPNYQMAGYLAGGLPAGVEIWSKAGHNLWTGDARTSWFKHDMIRIKAAGRKPLIIVVMTEGRGLAETEPQAFAAIARLLWDMTEEITRA